MSACILFATPASADCYQTIVQTHCAPNSGYFSVRTFNSYDLCYPDEEESLFTLKHFEKNTVSCSSEKFAGTRNDGIIGTAILEASGNIGSKGEFGRGDNRTEIVLKFKGEEILSLGTIYALQREAIETIVELEVNSIKRCIIRYEDYSDEYKMPEQLTNRKVTCQQISKPNK